jgi:hypothetical protein
MGRDILGFSCTVSGDTISPLVVSGDAADCRLFKKLKIGRVDKLGSSRSKLSGEAVPLLDCSGEGVGCLMGGWVDGVRALEITEGVCTRDRCENGATDPVCVAPIMDDESCEQESPAA